MSTSLLYNGNGVYTAHLESGPISITKEEIYDLVKEVAKKDTIPTFVADFEFNECWNKIRDKTAKTISTLNSVSADTIVEDEVEDFADQIISTSQNVANEYYKEHYILIDKN